MKLAALKQESVRQKENERNTWEQNASNQEIKEKYPYLCNSCYHELRDPADYQYSEDHWYEDREAFEPGWSDPDWPSSNREGFYYTARIDFRCQRCVIKENATFEKCEELAKWKVV